MKEKIWKNKNAVCRLQIFPEIFKFEKRVKDANEMTDIVVYSADHWNLVG